MAEKLAAFVRQTDIHPPTRHYLGMDSTMQGQIRLPWPQLLLIEETPGGRVLDRYTRDGAAVGDTWHASVKAAQDQARNEYGDLLSEWKVLPTEKTDEDLVEFVSSYLLPL